MAEVRRTVQNLKPGKEYILTVRAKNTDLNVLSEYSDAIRFTVPTDETVPEVPSNLELVASFLNVMFVFDSVSDKDIQSYEYEVYKQAQITGTGPNWEIITGESPFRTGFSPSNVFVVSVDENTSLDNSSNPSATESPVYYFGRVRSVDTTGNVSDWTDIVVSGDTPLIDDEYVASLTASKITAGTIGAHEITLNGTNSIIKSSDYDGTYTLDGLGNRVWSQGTSGWVITGDGYSEFDVTNVRGTLSASSIVIDSNNYWNSDGTFKVGDGTQYVQWDGSNLTVTGSVTADSLYINSNNYWNNDGTMKVGGSSSNMIWNNSSLTVNGASISSSVFSTVDGLGNGVTVNNSGVLINVTGTGTGAKLKFNTNAGSGFAIIENDKLLRISTGGSGTETYFDMGTLSGASGGVYAFCQDFRITSACRPDTLQVEATGSGVIRTQNTTSGGINGVTRSGTSANDSRAPYVACRIDSSGGRPFIGFTNYSAAVGSISYNGSGTSYNTSSDYRIKENVSDFNDGLTIINSLKPKNYVYIKDADRVLRRGFLAHEVQEVMPEIVLGEKDAMNEDGTIDVQLLDYVSIVTPLVSAVQQLSKEIEYLKQQVGS